MAKNIFVSYNFNDREVTCAVKNMIQAHQDELKGKVVFVENDVSYNGKTAVNWEIEHTMETCDASLFVLATATTTALGWKWKPSTLLPCTIPVMTTVLPGECDDVPSVLKSQIASL